MTDWHRVLRAVAPHGAPDIIGAVADHAEAEFPRFGLTSRMRQVHILGHMAVETLGFTRLDENLNYSAERLRAVWPARFKDRAVAEACAHNPRALAIKVYGGRMGNRPGTDDGWTFRGAGLLQVTGRENVTKLAGHLGVSAETVATWLTDPERALRCACAMYVMLGCLPLADRGLVHPAIVDETRHINGGLTGLAEREAAINRFFAALEPDPRPIARPFGGLGLMTAIDAPEPELSRESIPSSAAGDVLNDLPELEVRSLQLRLRKKGYFSGIVDGKPGSALRGALAAFQTDNHLPRSCDLDESTRAALGSELTPDRPIGEERANTTVADLRAQGSATIAAADAAGSSLTGAGVFAGGTGAVAVVGRITDGITTAKSAQDAAAQVPDMWHWLVAQWPLALLLACLALLLWKHRAIKRQLNRLCDQHCTDYHEFRHTHVGDR